MPTAAISTTVGLVKAAFPGVTVQVDSCRKIAGSSSWSQHSWGNAADFFPKNKEQGDRLYNYIIAGKQAGILPVTTVCWQDKGGCTTFHGDHIHVDGSPKKTGTPPCAGGQKSNNPLDAIRSFFDDARAVEDEYRAGVRSGEITIDDFGNIPGNVALSLAPTWLKDAEGIPALGLPPNANTAERAVTFILGFAFIVLALVLIAWELRGTVIGNTISKAVK